jgi:stearoyl-CoA desaturase (delta-9 desaturase)
VTWLAERWRTIVAWFDTGSYTPATGDREHRVEWVRILPFIGVHLMCLGPIWVGWSWTAVVTAVGLYWLRAFALTAFYHRYFSHRAFRTSRAAQFLFAALGASAAQRGPLWWAAHHRLHHRHSDGPGDVHSPHQHGFWWSHMGWITSPPNFPTRLDQVPDLARYPELRLLDRFDVAVPVLLATGLYAAGHALGAAGAGTSGPQMLVWGFFISTVALFHATCLVNSLAHQSGSRRYQTADQSRNNLVIALLTMGEGWHNNHHRYPGAARQGFRWWEIDPTYYILKIMAWVGLVRDLHGVPVHVLAEATHGQRARV